jgi:type I restriction enzyme S subunit
MIHERIEADNKASPWIGTLPSGWSLKSIKRVVSTPITDGPHETPELSDDGVQFISAEAIKNNRIDFNRRRGFISRELHELYSRKCKPQKNDIFIVKSGATTGNVAYVDVDFEFNIWSPLAVIRCKPRTVSHKFLFYQFQSESFRKQVELSWSFGTQENIGMGVLGRIKVILPLLPEQKLIAAYLDASCGSIDKALTSKQRQLETLDALRKSIITSAVLQGISPDRAQVPTGSSWLPKIPNGWKLVSLKRVSTTQTGITLGKTYESPLIERPYLRAANVQDGRLDLNKITTIEIPPELAQRYELQYGDVLMTEGGDLDKLGRGYPWEGQIPGCLHQNHVFAIRTNRRLLLPQFLAYVTASRYGRDYFEATGKRTTNLASTNSTKVGLFPIPLPPLQEQKEIVNHIDQQLSQAKRVEDSIAEQIETLTAYRKFLIHECVTGQRRISEADVTHAQAHV